MIQEPLDLRKAYQLVRRHRLLVWLAALAGVVAGSAFTLFRPPVATSEAWILVALSAHDTVGTQVVVAGSDPVLGGALRTAHLSMPLDDMRDRVDVRSRTSTIIAVDVVGDTDAESTTLANAVAASYVDFAGHPGNLPDGPVQARVLQPATVVNGSDPSSRLIGMSLLGGLLGAVTASLAVVAVGRRDRRLRERDEIADSIGVPVLASVRVAQPTDAAGWTRLLADYEPGAVDAWRLRKALQFLGLADQGATQPRRGGISLTVMTFSSDKALAVGPQLAAFAASRGLSTALVVGPRQDVSVAATLRAACAAASDGTTGRLRVLVRDRDESGQDPDAALTVVVTVVDRASPRVADAVRGGSTVLGVSAGLVTGEELARAAAAAAAAGHNIIGILVADPDPADPTTGRLPEVARPARGRRPTRATGTRAGSGR